MGDRYGRLCEPAVQVPAAGKCWVKLLRPVLLGKSVKAGSRVDFCAHRFAVRQMRLLWRGHPETRPMAARNTVLAFPLGDRSNGSVGGVQRMSLERVWILCSLDILPSVANDAKGASHVGDTARRGPLILVTSSRNKSPSYPYAASTHNGQSFGASLV